MTNRITQWVERHDSSEHPLVPAATVLLVRDGASGLETLMMRRNSKLSFADGMWVFPGGKIDPEDHGPHDTATATDLDAAAVSAAVREAREEADLHIEIDSLVYYAHWLPPMQAPKRFSTWFYIAPAPAGAVTVDQGEITDHAWWRPADALQRVDDRRIEVLPPTWMSLNDLAQFTSVAETIETVRSRGPRAYATRVLFTADGLAAAWEGDAGYDTGDPDAAGGRHRLVMGDGPWRLERQL